MLVGLGPTDQLKKRQRNVPETNYFHTKMQYRSGMVNSKSFVSKDFLRIKWEFELIYAL